MIINKKYNTINDAIIGVKNVLWSKPDSTENNKFEKLGFVFQIKNFDKQGSYCIESDLFLNVLKSVERLSDVVKEDISFRDDYNNLITFAYRVNQGIYCHLHLSETNLNSVKLNKYLNELKFTIVGLSNVIEKEIGEVLVSIVSLNCEYKEHKQWLVDGDLDNNIHSLSKLGTEILELFKQKNITLNVIRHGETEHNINHVLQGQTNSPLVDEDYRNEDLFEVVENSNFVFSSKLGRAIKTALKYAKDFEQDELLNEMSWGDVDGHVPVTTDFIRYSNTIWKHANDRYYTKAESLVDLYQRLVTFLYKLYYKVEIGQTVTLFSHNLPLIALRAMSMDKPYDYLTMTLEHEKNYKLF